MSDKFNVDLSDTMYDAARRVADRAGIPPNHPEYEAITSWIEYELITPEVNIPDATIDMLVSRYRTDLEAITSGGDLPFDADDYEEMD